MAFINRIDATLPRALNPMTLYSRLLDLAEDTDRSGFRVAAEHLFYLALQVFEHPDELQGTQEKKE